MGRRVSILQVSAAPGKVTSPDCGSAYMILKTRGKDETL
jgi:hypothetical protein